ncbi:MAG: hypothetical protein ACOCXG_04480 [Nanoarchaeota archaeon]
MSKKNKCNKNCKLAIFLVFGVLIVLMMIFSGLAYSVVGFDDSDFNMTNLYLDNGLIELGYLSETWFYPDKYDLIDPYFDNPDNGGYLIGWSTDYDSTFKEPTLSAFCANQGYPSYSDYELRYSASTGDYRQRIAYSEPLDSWHYYQGFDDMYYLDSITCVDDTQLAISGSMVSKDIVLEEDINKFTLDDNYVEYGGSVESYIIYNDGKYYFKDDNTLDLSVSEGDTINLGYDVTRSDASPEIENSITLSMQYVDSATGEVTSEDMVFSVSETSSEPMFTDNSFFGRAGNSLIGFSSMIGFWLFGSVTRLIITISSVSVVLFIISAVRSISSSKGN